MAENRFSQNEVMALWQNSWPEAVKIWNPYVSLREPVWCLKTNQAKGEGLEGSFAMIRLSDHRIVIDLEMVEQEKVGEFALQILAHEIGHHVFVPANLYDNAGLISRMRLALAGIESRVPLVANLYSDLLINDRLQRSFGLDMAAVYQRLQQGRQSNSALFTWYMRTFEYLWGLSRGSISGEKQSPQIDADASLAAALVRSYSRLWLKGAARFALLAYPYLIEDKEHEKAGKAFARLLDAQKSGAGAEVVGGLAEIDEGMLDEVVDPRSEALESLEESDDDKNSGDSKDTGKRKKPAVFNGKSLVGGAGPGQRYQEPGVYLDLMRQIDPQADENKLINRYYREIALPHLVPFPVEESAPLAEMLPEGTDEWLPGDPVEELDWFETTMVSPVVIPGVTTRSRVFSPDFDTPSRQQPYNLYVGIDCSGSMNNPRFRFSWPICAGTIVSLSALRVGARVMACLSGEPGSFMETNGFETSEENVLTVLTSYLGTGYAYGIPRLQTPHLKNIKGKTHLLIVSDDDIFSMLQASAPGGGLNFDVAEAALNQAGGGGTFVLHSRSHYHKKELARLRQMGWVVHFVADERQMLSFARAFANQFYRRTSKKND